MMLASSWALRLLGPGVLERLVARVTMALTGTQRPACPQCCLKHLGQARAELLELRKGYPEFFWFALGHLAEAEDEIVQQYPGLADAIRAQRKQLERLPGFVIDFRVLVNDVAAATGLDVDAALENLR